MADATYQPKVYRKQGGEELVVASGGKINRESGALEVVNRDVTNITTAGNVTYTAAQLNGGIITRDPNGSGRTDSTDTAANLISELGLEADGDTAECYVINTADGAEAITIGGGTGVTIANAGQTIGQNESAKLIIRRASATTAVVYIVGA